MRLSTLHARRRRYNHNSMNRFIFLIPFFAFFSCSTEKQNNLYDDPVHRHIADLKDRRMTDSLYQYLDHADPVYRREAAMAFGSIQDTMAISRVSPLLHDEVSDVRIAAAFALGQTRAHASTEALMAAASTEKDSAVLTVIAEAIGKNSTKLDAVWDLPAEGKAWAIYRAGLRRHSTDEINQHAASLLTDGNESTRLAAAHYFLRGAGQPENHFEVLCRAAKNDSSVDVRMAATAALRKIPSDSSFQCLETILASDDDYRVKVSAIRALGGFPYGKTKQLLFNFLTDRNEHIAVAASETILATSRGDAWIELSNIADQVSYWRARANIYQAALKGNDFTATVNEVKTLYQQSADPYHRAAYLSGLQAAPSAHGFLHEQLIKADTPVVRTAAAAALVAINRSEKFNPAWRQVFLNFYKEGINTGDAAVIGTYAAALTDPRLGYRDVVRDISFLLDAKARLSLPKDNEALQPLEAAIAYFENRKAPEVTNAFNNPIDWDLVKTIPSDATATIRTSRGHIRIRLFVDEAPGSVANFVRLARERYFDRKFFHRVVPNFVIQAGCNRGDGWGSEDYSIRSEFGARKYTTGSVGMASAGKDTEGTQWFITHSPTPHLDGNYTIFAEVVEGMAVVHLMQVGDQILGVDLPFLNQQAR